MTGAGRHAWIDAGAGVAGDMLLGALVDAGADLDTVQLAVDAVIPGSVRLDRSTVTRAGQRATKIDVSVLDVDRAHRDWSTIRGLLVDSSLTEGVRQKAIAVFGALAGAEARVHGIPVGSVHFHEVGALDSIADVVGVCAAFAQLGIGTASVSPIALGAGRTTAAHGNLPVPVPAVLQLSRGRRVRAGGDGELTTPTGMALVATLAAGSEDLPLMTVDSVGVGAGTRDTDGRPNVTRIVLGDRQRIPAGGDDVADAATVLQANVDDLDPRLWPGILTRILAAGAADAWLVPIVMKKGRPAHTLAVLARPDQAPALRDLIFAETSTIGIRETSARKFALARTWVDVPLGEATVPVKIAHRDGVIVQVTPEFDAVEAHAISLDRPVRVALDEAVAAAATAGLVTGTAVPATAPGTGTSTSTSTSKSEERQAGS